MEHIILSEIIKAQRILENFYKLGVANEII